MGEGDAPKHEGVAVPYAPGASGVEGNVMPCAPGASGVEGSAFSGRVSTFPSAPGASGVEGTASSGRVGIFPSAPGASGVEGNASVGRIHAIPCAPGGSGGRRRRAAMGSRSFGSRRELDRTRRRTSDERVRSGGGSAFGLSMTTRGAGWLIELLQRAPLGRIVKPHHPIDAPRRMHGARCVHDSLRTEHDDQSRSHEQLASAPRVRPLRRRMVHEVEEVHRPFPRNQRSPYRLSFS